MEIQWRKKREKSNKKNEVCKKTCAYFNGIQKFENFDFFFFANGANRGKNGYLNF